MKNPSRKGTSCVRNAAKSSARKQILETTRRSAQVKRREGRKHAPIAKRSTQHHTSLDICVPVRQRKGAKWRWWPSPGQEYTRQKGKIARDVASRWLPQTSPDIFKKYAIASEWHLNVEGYTPIGSGRSYQDQEHQQQRRR